MAVGLPIITSHLGNLRRYAEESGAATCCMDPADDAAFERAILRLRDPKVPGELGQSGARYTRTVACFEKQARECVQIMGGS